MYEVDTGSLLHTGIITALMHTPISPQREMFVDGAS